MDVLESLSNYSEEDQSKIMNTLIVVQERGWSQDNSDPYQFHIILVEKMLIQTNRLNSLESILENVKEENLQKEKYLKDLKADLEHQKDINEDMEDGIKKKHEVIQSLQYGIDGKMKNIDDLVQIRNENEEKTNMLEKKASVQHNLIEELKVNLKEKDETNTKENEDLDKLKKEKKLLELTNKEKEVASDNVMLKEKLESLNMHFKCKACDYRFESHEDQTVEEIESLYL